MAEQFLQRAKVGSTRKEMRCEAVPKRMGRKAFGQTQPLACRCNGTAHEVGIERTTASAEEQRPIALDGPGALAHVGFDRFTDRGHDWYDARLRPLAGDPQRLADRPRVSGKRQGLRDAETRALTFYTTGAERKDQKGMEILYTRRRQP